MIYQNLGQFLRNYSREHKDHIAYEIRRGFRMERFTFGEVESLARKTATFLAQRRLTKGDKIAIWAPNMPEYPILYFGLWLMGCVAVPIDVRTTKETLKVFLTKAKCKVGFKGKFIPDDFGDLVKESFYLEDLVESVGDLAPITNYELPITSNDLAEIAFTSGTTGTPKGVMLTHGNFLSDVEALTNAFPFKKEYRALSLLPLSHAFEQVADFLALFQSGIKVTYLERTNRLTIMKAIRKGKITSVALVPQALQLLMSGIENEVEKQGKEKVWVLLNWLAPTLPIWVRRILFRQVHKKLGGNLLFFGCGSAPLNLKLAQKWENLGVEIFEGYGATETTAVLTINTPSVKRLGSVGKILPGTEVRINPVTSSYFKPGLKHIDKPGLVGEIEARGPNISPGYFSAKGGSASGGEDEEKTRAAFWDSWYRTGDVGEFDRDGFLYITGREAFRIVLPNGQKVYPEDVEKKLNSHPLVVESCVVGVTREEGEVVHAAVITKYPAKLGEIIRQVNETLSSHEQILEWSLWKGDDFPRTPILKIDRKRVLEVGLGIAKKEEEVKITTADTLVNILSQVAKVSVDKITEKSILASDLKIDSLGRVELLSCIEDELGAAVPETKITAQTTISKLRNLIKQSPATTEEIPINEFMYSPFMIRLRAYILQNFIFRPLHSLFVPIDVNGRENLKNLKLPAIFYFNHVGIFDAAVAMRVLPNKIREKMVSVVNADIWKDYRKRWVEIFGGGFPFDKKDRVKASLELTGDFLDRGFSLLISPEGEFSKDGKLLTFKPGIGLLDVEMGVPAVPIKIDPSYLEIFPPMDGRFIENLPKKRKKIWIKIGKPMTFSKETSYEEATERMQEALDKL